MKQFSVAQQVMAQMIRDIEKLPPHTKIASRPTLSEQYYACRQTIDRVVNTLCREGYLYAVPGAGTYVADPVASMSRGEKITAKSVGVLLPTHGINIAPKLERGICDAAQRNGVRAIFCISDHNPHKQLSYIRRLLNSNVSGFIIQPPGAFYTLSETVAYLNDMHTPSVYLFSRPSDDIRAPLVSSNIFTSRLECVRHLLAQGYRRIGYAINHVSVIPGMLDTPLMASLRFMGAAYDPFCNCIANTTRDEFILQLTRLLLSSYAPDALICFNDSVAACVYEAAMRANVRIPQQLGVVGTDNSELCQKLSPPLSSVDNRAYDMAVMAMDLLLEYHGSANPPCIHRVIEPELVVRGSSTRRP